MKTQPCLLPVCLAAISLLTLSAQAQYTFGTAYEPTPPAAIALDASTGTFQYTNISVTGEDAAYLPLAGTAGTYISADNAWTASVSPVLAARSMTATASQTPDIGIGLLLEHTIGESIVNVRITAGQVNNTGGANNTDYIDGYYGTGSAFAATTNGALEATMPLGKSEYLNGECIVHFTAATNLGAATESLPESTGVVTLSYEPSDNTVTGYCNGTALGSFSLASWGSHPALTLYVFGASAEGIAVPASTATATNFSAGLGTFTIPELAVIQSGANCILQWTTNSAGFTLQSTADLISPVWTVVSPSPAIVNGQNTVTNSLSGTQRFFKLSL
jgi:hypothetical protein